MSFQTDKQTLDDLNILGKAGADSVYSIFNQTSTLGGSRVLEQLFRYPLSDSESINNRSGIIQYFNSIEAVFPFQPELFDAVEPYLANTDERSKLSNENNTLGRKITYLIAADTEYRAISGGVMAVIEIMNGLGNFIQTIGKGPGIPYRKEMEVIEKILAEPEFEALFTENSKSKLSYEKISAYDRVIRFRHRSAINKLLQYIYELDVYICVAKVARDRAFIFPKALSKEQHIVELDGVYHPQLKNPVPNNLYINPDSNIIFLTGANMAGKSTFMKTLGIAMFLAHMGFPIAAKKMEFSVRDGIYTSINLSDNLGMGVSHFYAEVLRIKMMAMEISAAKNLFIIFDELFRGTNVKDAFEATIAITTAFAKKRNCMFVVSTHIMEAGEVLRERCSNISFKFLPTMMKKNVPEYTYTLQSGITADRHGMVIITNEGILDILGKAKMKKNPA